MRNVVATKMMKTANAVKSVIVVMIANVIKMIGAMKNAIATIALTKQKNVIAMSTVVNTSKRAMNT